MKTNPNDPIGACIWAEKDRNTGEVIKSIIPGLTKREHFASLAMQGQVSHYGAANPESVAKLAVKMADALIQELNKSVDK